MLINKNLWGLISKSKTGPQQRNKKWTNNISVPFTLISFTRLPPRTVTLICTFRDTVRHKHNETPSCQGKTPGGDDVQIWIRSELRLLLRIRLGLGMSRRQAQGSYFKRMNFHKLSLYFASDELS